MFFSPESFFQIFFNSAGKSSLIFSFLLLPGALIFLFVYRLHNNTEVIGSGKNEESGEKVRIIKGKRFDNKNINDNLQKPSEPLLKPDWKWLFKGFIYSLLLLIAIVIFGSATPIQENAAQFSLRCFLAFSVIFVSILYFSDSFSPLLNQSEQISGITGQLLFLSIFSIIVTIIGDNADSVRYASLNYLIGATILFTCILLIRFKDYYRQAGSKTYSFANGVMTGMFVMWILPGKLSSIPGDFLSALIKPYTFSSGIDIYSNLILLTIIVYPIFVFRNILSKGIEIYIRQNKKEANLSDESENEDDLASDD